ncbi:MAG: hypothetical protein K8T91_08030 [Planctomycetes bacterium]|nr:hypothetical protein [Planctomycetota bacterium]
MAASLLNTALGLALTLLLMQSGKPLRGSTLIGPWLWGIISAATLTMASFAALPSLAADVPLTALFTYAAEVSTLCPLVALLGARRPQHNAWQFVVATLYAILLVPAFQGGRTGGEIAIEAPWSWFMLGLIGVGILNTMPTRYWLAAVALAFGQLILLAPHLLTSSGPTWAPQQSRMTAGLGVLIVAVLLLRWRAAAALMLPAWQARDPLDRLWIDFRDAFGVLWALRVQQRVNAAAEQYGWPVELTWEGFYDRISHQPATAMPADVRAALEHILRSVLWRFMSEPWMEQRLSGLPEERS